jgi:hypothetical protein
VAVNARRSQGSIPVIDRVFDADTHQLTTIGQATGVPQQIADADRPAKGFCLEWPFTITGNVDTLLLPGRDPAVNGIIKLKQAAFVAAHVKIVVP